MTDFVVAAFHFGLLPVGAEQVDTIVRITPGRLGAAGAAATLRIWTPAGGRVGSLREISPDGDDLLARAVPVDERTSDYDAGRWRDGTREYELVVAVTPGADGDELLAARVAVLADGEVAGRAAIAVTFGTLAGPPGTGTDAGAGKLAELPTGPSPYPRHNDAPEFHAGDPCPSCGEQTSPDDHFCEGCGSVVPAG